MKIKHKILLLSVGLVLATCLLSFFPKISKAQIGYGGGGGSTVTGITYTKLPNNAGWTQTIDSQFVSAAGITPKTESSVITNEQYAANMAKLTSDQYKGDPVNGPVTIDNMNGINTILPGSAPFAAQKPSPGIGSQMINFFIWLISFVLYFVSVVVGLLLYIAGSLIDFFFSANKLASSDIVKNGWTFTRDTLNFVFILVLLAISFSTIAGLETFQMRKALPSLIFAALLVNFSLAIGGAFLQVSNVLTDSIASSLLGTTDRNAVGKKLTTGLVNSGDIGAFYTYSDVTWVKGSIKTLLPKKGSPISLTNAMTKDWTEYLLEAFNSALALVMVCIFAVAFVFLAALMAIRLVMLVILLILSPVPFVFSVIPKLKPYADKWWSSFINYVIFLPVATFFLALAIKLLSTKTAGGTTPLVSQFFDSSGSAPTGITTGVMGSIIDMVFVSIFIFASLLVAKSLGIFGADVALSAAKKTAVGAAKIGAVPAVMAGHGAAKVGLVAADKAGNIAAKTPYVGSALRGARTAGRAAQRLYKGQESRDQLAEKEKALAGMGEDELRSAYERGNVAAGMKLMGNDDLKKEEYAGLAAKVPKGSEAADKVKSNWKRKDPINAIMGSEVRSELMGTSRLSQSSQEKVDKNREDLQTAFKKMKPEDYAKLDGDDLRAAIKAGIKVPLTKSQLDATMGSANTDLQNAASEHLNNLENNPEAMNPGQVATLSYARNKLKMTNKNNPSTSGTTTPQYLPGSGSVTT